MKPKTNIQDLGKQFETTNKQDSKQFHNSKLKKKILTILGMEWENNDWDWPDFCPSLKDITFGCYNLPSTKYPPSGKEQAVYQSLCSLRKEGKVVLLESIYYKTDDTTAICEQIKRLLHRYTERKAAAEHLLNGYNTQLRYFYALYQYINATGRYEGFGEHWSNRNEV